MNKQLLNDYIDACELVEETELELKRLEGKQSTMAMDKVKGSMSDFPYAQKSFKIEGAVDIKRDENAIRVQKMILMERKNNAERIKQQVEKWMNKIPVRMQRIIKYHFFEGLSWEKVADEIGQNTTGNSLRMEFERFLQKK